MNFILADNQELTRYALEAYIRTGSTNTIQVVADKGGLLEALIENEQSVVLLDYTLFDYADESELFDVSEKFVLSQWVLLSDELSPDTLRRIVNSSRRFSVVYKDSPMVEIIEAVKSAEAGRRYLCQRAIDLILVHQQKDTKSPNILTATEQEIVKSIARGLTTKDIAKERFSSIHTINTHRKNILHKLGISTSNELIRYAIRTGLFDPTEYYI